MPLPELLVPVPLHPSRHRERGFNQASEIARPVAGHLRIALDEDVCACACAPPMTRQQLDRRERRRNVRRAFAFARRPRCRVTSRSLDDVLTTGSTANELARMLKRGGVKR